MPFISANDSGNLVTVWIKYFSASEGLIELFQIMVQIIAFEFTVPEILRVEMSKKLFSQQKKPKSCVFED